MNVIVEGSNNNRTSNILFSDSNSYDNLWKYGSVYINNFVEQNYKIIVEGIVGLNTIGDIALDDFSIFNDVTECKPPPSSCEFKCSNGTCLSSEKVCNFMNDCENGEEEVHCGYNDITFENGTKGWNETSYGLFRWNLNNYDNKLTGPQTGNLI